MTSVPLLSLVTFIPLIGMFVILLIDRENKGLIRGVAFTTGLIDFLLSLPLFFQFELTSRMQFVERVDWIPQFGVSYHMGIDGISMLLVLLTTLTCVICYAATWTAVEKHVKEFMALSLLLQTGMIGVFCALDFFLFYVFWEIMLIPMYFIIGVWGGARRIYAAIKFFIYTMFGSVLMLVAILWLYFHQFDVNGVYTTDILAYHGLPIGAQAQTLLFLAFFLAFAIKVPVFPFHTWLPDAHVEAPTVGSVILAGILLKMGTYGFLRFSLPIFPQATLEAVHWIMILSVVGIVYGAWVATVQTDIKKLVAYSSVSHLGFVMMGMFALSVPAVEGAIMQMLNHGVTTGALFLAVGVLYERRHTRLISEYGGITKVMPIFATLFMIVTLSSIGLPGTNGFIGEFLILMGTWKEYPAFVVVATSGVIWAAVYMLWMFQRVMFEKITKKENENLKDMNLREIAYFAPFIVLIFVMGIFPTPFLEKMEPSVVNLIRQVKGPEAVAEYLPAEQAVPTAVADGTIVIKDVNNTRL
jgi:NADH-quinone oxidoreductase subunit M